MLRRVRNCRFIIIIIIIIIITNLTLLALTVTGISIRGPNYLDAPLTQTPLILALKVITGKLLTNPKLYTKYRGFQFFLDALLVQTPSNFGPKTYFW